MRKIGMQFFLALALLLAAVMPAAAQEPQPASEPAPVIQVINSAQPTAEWNLRIRVFFDKNRNGIKDAGEEDIAGQGRIQIETHTLVYWRTSNTSSFYIQIAPGEKVRIKAITAIGDANKICPQPADFIMPADANTVDYGILLPCKLPRWKIFINWLSKDSLN